MKKKHIGLVVPFPNESESFTLGFEAGIIWHKLTENHDVIDLGFLIGFPIHIDNQEIIENMADYHGYRTEYKTTDAKGWIGVRLTKIQTPVSIHQILKIK